MRSSIEEQLLYYSELTLAERLHVDQQVQQRPELRVLLEEAKAFSAVINEAQQLHASPPSDEALAYFIATRRVSPHALPGALQEVFERIDEKLKVDVALHARYTELLRRMTALEAASNPIKQFEQLSGHQLPVPVYDAASLNGEDLAATETTLSTPLQPVQRPLVYRMWTHAGRWAMAAIVSGVVLYGSLALVSHFSQSDLDLIAVLDPATLQVPAMRSGASETDTSSPDALYRQALVSLQEVQLHTLGLFPHYDVDQLRHAEGLLERVVDLEPSSTPLWSRANYVLAEVRVAQKNVDGAKVALQAILDGSGANTEEAQALLDQLNSLSE